jgi:hypothetical protein
MHMIEHECVALSTREPNRRMTYRLLATDGKRLSKLVPSAESREDAKVGSDGIHRHESQFGGVL